MTVTVRLGTAADLTAVAELYREWNYRTRALPEDLLVVAEEDRRVVGVVRHVVEHGHHVLRGMRVQPSLQRMGVGTRMLKVFVEHLGDHECLALPYVHLLGFYGQVGFREIPSAEAPPHLVERLASYRAEGLDMTIIRRSGPTGSSQ